MKAEHGTPPDEVKLEAMDKYLVLQGIVPRAGASLCGPAKAWYEATFLLGYGYGIVQEWVVQVVQRGQR